MRLLIATVSLVAMAGAAFAGEPQKATTAQQTVVASAKAPAKLTDQQMDKIVAGDSGNNTATCVINSNGFNHMVASTKGGGIKGSDANNGAVFVGPACF